MALEADLEADLETGLELEDRRALWRRLAGGAAALGAAGTASAQSAFQVTGQSAPSRPGLGGEVLKPDPILFLVNRITQGFNLKEYEFAKSLGYEGYLEYQLDHVSIDDTEMDQRLLSFDTLTMTSKEILDTYGATGMTQVPVQQLQQAAILRSVFSKRQLFERMVEFWTDHFNVDHIDDQVRILKTADDRDVIRQYALGSFEELLKGSAHSAAMSYYLDNYTNVFGTAQENYARELMELHTLGAGNFSEGDVGEVARAFTGWSYEQTFASPSYGAFRFSLGDHDPFPKVVLGQPVVIGGKGDGNRVLNILLAQDATADFLSRKMIRWLLTENPSEGLVGRVKKAYFRTGGSIKAMIRAILAKENLTAENPWFFKRFKRPFTLYTSLIRALELDVTNALVSSAILDVMGQQPFAWPAPNGYPDSIYAWGGNLVPRWDFVSRVTQGPLPGVVYSAPLVSALISATGKPLPEAIDEILTGGQLDSEDLDELRAFVNSFPQVNQAVVREALALAASSPSYQFH